MATDIPSESFGSLQYNLSAEQLALIQENAQQYMQEHEDSPWEVPVLQPAAESPKAMPTGGLLLKMSKSFVPGQLYMFSEKMLI